MCVLLYSLCCVFVSVCAPCFVLRACVCVTFFALLGWVGVACCDSALRAGERVELRMCCERGGAV